MADNQGDVLGEGIFGQDPRSLAREFLDGGINVPEAIMRSRMPLEDLQDMIHSFTVAASVGHYAGAYELGLMFLASGAAEGRAREEALISVAPATAGVLGKTRRSIRGLFGGSGGERRPGGTAKQMGDPEGT